MSIKRSFSLIMSLLMVGVMPMAYASLTVPMQLVGENGKKATIGSVSLDESFGGVLITPNLYHLPPGNHGFHVHVNPSCEDKGMAAGGHFDPDQTEQHRGPYQHGHQGDLPILIVNADGTATLPVFAPRFQLNKLHQHALMIHAGGDNYADQPEKLGGGGARIACGVIE